MLIPLATYRLQFNPNFDFSAAQAIVPYLAELGISTIYASPIFQPKKGSTHGYDVVDYNQISSELGGKSKFSELIKIVHQYNLDWLQDIVPNHSAFSSQNQMLVDLLENGPNSQYANYFDIDWNHPYEGIKGRVLAPFLGKFYGDCLENGELEIKYDRSGFSVNYYEHKYPLKVDSYSQILDYNLAKLRKKLGRNHPDFVKFLGVLYALKYLPDGAEGTERYDQITFIKEMLWELWNENQDIQDFIKNNITVINGVPGQPESFDLLDKLLASQFFRLSFWKVGNEELNYRRFFTINDLIAMRVEDEQVFKTTHALTLQLLAKGKFSGLRIDHIDGLYDPYQYLKRLREFANTHYIVVEKILDLNEQLPLNWPVQGTTGYDFLNYVNAVFCQNVNGTKFTKIYGKFLGYHTSCEQLIYEKQRLIVQKHLAGDIDNLAHLLKQLSGKYRYTSDFTTYALKAALVEVMADFPVYRTYINQEGISKTDREVIQQVIANAQVKIPTFLNELANELHFIEKFLLLEFDDNFSTEDKDLWLHFVMRFQQFTGPLMAKGVEDTVFYIYNRLVSLNEVGSHPSKFGISVDEFHSFNDHRNSHWPHTLNATATHDTKRGEDVRSRINVLSEIPEEWQEQLKHWQTINANKKEMIEDRMIPTPNDEYFLYQNMLGAFPFDPAEYPHFSQRIKDYMIKAMREAKVNTGWLQPEQEYENGVLRFIDRLLEDTENNEFFASFKTWQKRIEYYGIFNSLSQTLLKLTSPGVPDIYQGTELWDLSLVDPDNRRPVDFTKRTELLQDIKGKIEIDLPSLIEEIIAEPANGKIKLFLIYQVLRSRRHYADLFQRGDYQKLMVIGSLKEHIITFARQWGEQRAIVIVPRLLTNLVKLGEYPLGDQVWHETRIALPSGSHSIWHNMITGQQVDTQDTLWIKDVFSLFPVALLVNENSV